MRQKSGTGKAPAEQVIKDICRDMASRRGLLRQLDFAPAKAHVSGMCMNDRHLLTFYRVCPIAGI